MSRIETFIRARQKAGKLKSVTLIETRSGKWQASLDYHGKAYAVHVADDPIECLEYVLCDDTDQRNEIVREHRSRDTASEVYVADEQYRMGRPVELKKAVVPKSSATERAEPVSDAARDELDDMLS